MSSSIDQKVVELQFNNKAFEQNIQTTLASLDALKEKLDLGSDTGHSFDQLQRAANKLSLDNVTNAIQGVTDKLNYMTSVAGMAITKIKSQLASMATSFVKSITIEPLISGYQEYNTQMDSTQTIYSNVKNSGKSLQDVTDALDELNTYADKTIYNFTEMTRSIGMFTTAGVGLDTSVKSIKGISNLAALSGADANAANRAMYNLSQAMASGSVRLTDWMSIENANMGGKNFQEMLIKSAKLHDVDYDKLEKKYGSFRNTLSEGWLTADIMNDVLENLQLIDGDATEKELEAAKELLRNKGYSEEDVEYWIDMAQTASDAATKVKTFSQLIDTLKEAIGSGWSTTWRTIIGDFEEAKELFTSWSNELGDLVDASSSARNRILSAWKTFGGRDALIGGISNLYNTAKDIFENLGKGISGLIFGGTSNDAQLDSRGKDLADYTKKLEEATLALKEWVEGTNNLTGNTHLKDLQTIGKGIASAVNIISLGLQHLGTWVGNLFSQLKPGEKAANTIDSYLKYGSEIADWVWKLYLKLVRAKDMSSFISIFREQLAEEWNKFVKWLNGDAETGEEGAISKLKKWFLGEDTDGDGVIDKEGFLKGALLKWAEDIWYKAKVWLFGVSADQQEDGSAKESAITKIKQWFLGEDTDGDGYVDVDGALTKLQKWGKKIWYKCQAFLFGVSKYGGDGKGGAIGAIKRWWIGEDTDGDGEVDIEGFGTKLKNWSTELWNKAKDYIVSGRAWEDLKGVPAKIAQWFDKVLESVGLPEGSFTGFLDKVSEWFSNLWGKVTGWFNSLNLGNFSADLSGIATSIGDFFKGIWEAIKGLFSGGGEEITDGEADQISSTLTAVGSIADTIKSSGSGFSLKGLATDAIEGAIDFVSDILNYLLDKFPFKRIAGLLSLFVGLKGMTDISSGIKTLGNGINEIGQGFKMTALRKAGINVAEQKTGLQKFADSMKDIGKALLIIAASVAIVAIAAKIFDSVSWEGMGKMGAALAALVIVIFVIGKLTGKTRQAKKQLAAVGIAMAGIGAALVLTAVSVAILGAIPLDQLKQGGIAAVALLAILAVLTVLISRFASSSETSNITKAGIAAVLIAAVITLLTIPIFLLGSMKLETVVQGTIVVAFLALLLAGVVVLLSKFGSDINTKSLVGIALVTVCITALAAVVIVLAALPTDRLLAAAGVIAVIAIAIGGLGWALSALGPMAGNMLLGAAAFAGAIVILAVGVGGAMAILAGFLSGASNNLYKMALSLKHVSDSFAGVDGDGVQNGVDAFDKIVKMMKSANGLDTSGYDAVADRITLLGAKLKLFSDEVTGIDPEAGTKAEELAGNLKNIFTDLNAVGDLSDYESLSTSIANMGAALMLFAANTAEGEVSDQSITNAGRIGEILTALSSALPNSEVFDELSQFADDSEGSNLTNMALGIVNLATAMSDYSAKAALIDTESVGKVNQIVTDLATVQSSLSGGSNGGPFGWFSEKSTGEKMSDFAEGIVALGTAVSDFQDSVPDDATKSQVAVDIVDKIADIQAKLTDSTRTNNVIEWFSGQTDLSAFGQNLATLGGYLSDFANAIVETSINDQKVTSAVSVLEAMANIQAIMGENTGLRIQDLSWDLTSLPDRMNQFYEGLNKYDWSDEKTASTTASFAAMLGDIALTFNDFTADVRAGVTSLDGLQTTAYNAGVYIGQGLINGLGSCEGNVYKTAYGLGLTAIVGINAGADIHSPSKKAFQAGMFIDKGLANGIADYSGLVMSAGEQVSSDTLDTAQSLVDQFSSALTADANDQPVIRPVLDLTNLQNGSTAINSMLGNNYSINPGYISPPSNLNGERYGNEGQQVKSGGTDLGSAVQQLSEKINQLGDRITSMQLVLDSGELVGGIADQMDAELGARTIRKVRGN